MPDKSIQSVKTEAFSFDVVKTSDGINVIVAEGSVGFGDFPLSSYLDESLVSSVTEVSLPASFSNLSYQDFTGLNSLATINVSPDNPSYASVGGVLFDKEMTTLIRCPVGKEDTSYNVPDTVSKIESRAFANCGNLTDINMSENVTEVGVHAFTNTGCYNDKNNWENGVLYVGSCAAASKEPPSSVEIKDGTTTIGNGAFFGQPIEKVTIPDSVISVGEGAFAFCSELREVAGGDGVEFVGNDAFLQCSDDIAVVPAEQSNYEINNNPEPDFDAGSQDPDYNDPDFTSLNSVMQSREEEPDSREDNVEVEKSNINWEDPWDGEH